MKKPKMMHKVFATMRDFIFKSKGSNIPIVSVDNGRIITSTAGFFSATITKIAYMCWLSANCFSPRRPVEALPKSGTIAGGTLSLSFNSASDRADVVGYEIVLGFSDNISPGTINFSHAYTDEDAVANTFDFTVEPVFDKLAAKQSKVLLLTNGGVGAKYYPMLVRHKMPIPVAGGVTVETTSTFSITGPNDVRISILPISSSSVHIAELLGLFPFLISFLARRNKGKKGKSKGNKI